MFVIKNADIFKDNFYYFFPIIVTMTLQTFHTAEKVCLVTDIREKNMV